MSPKYTRLFLGIIISITVTYQPLESATHNLMPRGDHPNKMLLVFLDTSEFSLEAITQGFMSAFYQCAAPILVSTAILRNTIGHQMVHAPSTTTVQDIIREAHNIGPGQEKSILDKLKISSVRACLDITFQQMNFQKWSYFKANENLYLLVPSQDILGKAKFTEEPTLSERELKLGLKVDHLLEKTFKELVAELFEDEAALANQTILKEYLQKKLKATPQYAHYFVNAIHDGDIFIWNKEYIKKTVLDESELKGLKEEPSWAAYTPQWLIYMIGHGQHQTVISNIQIKKFREFLHILSKKLTIRILIIDSCYTVGATTKRLHESIGSTTRESVYPFPIIMTSLPNKTLTVILAEDPGFKIVGSPSSLQVEPLFSRNFSELNKKLQKNTPLPYQDLISLLFFKFSPQGTSFPRIRPAQDTRYIPLFPAIEIGKVMTKHRIKPLNLKEAMVTRRSYTADFLVLMLQSKYVPFAIDFTDLNKRIIISLENEGFYAFADAIIPDNISTIFTQLIQSCSQSNFFYIKKIRSSATAQKPLYTDAVFTDQNAYYRDGTTIKKLLKNGHMIPAQKVTEQDILYYTTLKERGDSVLMEEAIKNNDSTTTKNMLHTSFKINETILDLARHTDKNITEQIANAALTQAILAENTKLAKTALQLGANPNGLPDNAMQPLIVSIVKANDTLVALLLKHGATLATKDPTARGMLDIARNRAQSNPNDKADKIVCLIKRYQKFSKEETDLKKESVMSDEPREDVPHLELNPPPAPPL